MWTPTIEAYDEPKYLAIVSALRDDLQDGRLTPGEKLPTHRELASHIGVTVGTVGRAYAEAERRGLVTAHVGRGTFVSPVSELVAVGLPDGMVDLAHLSPPPGGDVESLRESLVALSEDPGLRNLMRYNEGMGLPHHRAAGAQWLRHLLPEANADGTLIFAGAQHAIVVILSTLLRAGDVVLAEELTYPGLKAAAHMARVSLVGLEMDNEGIRVDALEDACAKHRPRALYCNPTVQNPTTITISPRRRKAIATVAKRHRLLVIEDDFHGSLPADQPLPVTTHYPERSLYIASMSKDVNPGLRVAYVASPEELVAPLSAGIRASMWMVSPIMAEIATRWIIEGVAKNIVTQRREEVAKRQRLAAKMFTGLDYKSAPEGMHVWLALPPPWRSVQFTETVRQRGVAVTPAEVFALTRATVSHHVRLCLGTPPDRESVERALQAVLDTLSASDPTVTVL